MRSKPAPAPQQSLSASTPAKAKRPQRSSPAAIWLARLLSKGESSSSHNSK
jgi:hypothetical protein